MRLPALLMAVGLLCVPTISHADTFDYNLSGYNVNSCMPLGPYCGVTAIDFQISSATIPESHTATSFTYAFDQVVFAPDSYTRGDVTFHTNNTLSVGEFIPGFGYFYFNIAAFNPFPLFSGSTANPTLLAGASGPLFDDTWATVTASAAESFGTVDLDGSFIVTDLSTPTPEPSSILLLSTGLLGCAGLLRRRSVQATLGR